MKIKTFKIRLPEPFLYSDQQDLNDFLESHEIVKVDTAFVENENFRSVVLCFEDMKVPQHVVKDTKTVKYSVENESLSANEEQILNALKIWRAEKAKDQNLPIYFIATNKELMSVAKYKPARKEELLDIKGFGKHKIENYGEEILEILESI